MKQEFQDSMKPGVKYPGYATLNPYREFLFVPAQKGSREGRTKLVKEGKGWSVHSTNDNIIIHLRIPRLPKIMDRLLELFRLQDEIIQVFREYDLSKPQKNKKK